MQRQWRPWKYFLQQPGLSSAVFSANSLFFNVALDLSSCLQRCIFLFHSWYDTQFRWIPETRETRAVVHNFGWFWNRWLFQRLKGSAGQNRKATSLMSSFVTGLGMKSKMSWFMKSCPSCQLLKEVHCPFLGIELKVRAHLTQPFTTSGFSSFLTLLWARS